jgi:hypothetical protein
MASISSAKKGRKLSMGEVLTYRRKLACRATVRKYYAEWRNQQGMPVRCDFDTCRFYTEPLEWRGSPLTPILDHKNGNNLDNRAKNLRYICPNCDSQLDTRGGRNRGRVIEAIDGTFTLSRNGQLERHIICEPGNAMAAGRTANITNEPSAQLP